jgi:hypothetical protein
MEPLRDLMAKHLELSGNEWEQHQRVLAATECSSGRPTRRRFRASIAASLELEKACVDQIGELLSNPQPWSLLPPASLTLRHRCLVFRMLSRIGCCVEEVLMKEHRGMPTRLFTLIVGDVTAAAAEALRRSTLECLRDQWCRQLMHTYADMLSPEAQAVLILQASLHKFDIGQIEHRHSSIRRWLHARGLQTHVFEFQRLSAEWMAQQLRVYEAARSMRTLQPPAEAEPHTTNSSRSKKKRGGGGACRAYFSEALRRKRVKLTDAGVARQLHVEYTALGMAEKRRLCAVGKRAAKAWAKGDSKSTSAFGLKRKRDRLAEVNRRRNAALWHSLRAVGPEERLAVIVKQVFSSRSAAEHYRTLLRRARSVTLQDTTCSKVAKRHGVALLNAW